jgi:hypothetical protein
MVCSRFITKRYLNFNIISLLWKNLLFYFEKLLDFTPERVIKLLKREIA